MQQLSVWQEQRKHRMLNLSQNTTNAESVALWESLKITGLAYSALVDYLTEDDETQKLIQLASYYGYLDIRKVYFFGSGQKFWAGCHRPNNSHEEIPGIRALQIHRLYDF